MKVWLRVERPIDVEADIPLKDEASEKVKRQYRQENWGDLIIWANYEDGDFGCIRYNRSISMPLSEVSVLDLQEMKPGRGSGYLHLSFVTCNGKQLGSIYSSRCTKKSFDWLSKIQPMIANALNLEQRFSDHGYDA